MGYQKVFDLNEASNYQSTEVGGTLTYTNGLFQAVVDEYVDKAIDPYMTHPDDVWVYRIYPAYNNLAEIIKPPFMVQARIKISEDLFNAAMEPTGRNHAIVGPDLFDDWGHSAVQVALSGNHGWFNDQPHLILYHSGYGNNGDIGTLQPDAPIIEPDRWVRLHLVVDEQGTIKLFQDYKLLSVGAYTPDSLVQINSFHPGLYVWHYANRSVPMRGMLETEHLLIRGVV